ncbi:MAG: hypothetical protein U1F76_13860 [Candidatus Competibacteraceae bacterium]
MSSLPEYRLSPDEYLALERTADHRSEYAVAGKPGSREHGSLLQVL